MATSPLETERALFRAAVSSGTLKDLQSYLDKGLTVDMPDENNATALQVACQNNHPEIVKALLLAGANPLPSVLEYAIAQNLQPIVSIMRQHFVLDEPRRQSFLEDLGQYSGESPPPSYDLKINLSKIKYLEKLFTHIKTPFEKLHAALHKHIYVKLPDPKSNSDSAEIKTQEELLEMMSAIKISGMEFLDIKEPLPAHLQTLEILLQYMSSFLQKNQIAIVNNVVIAFALECLMLERMIPKILGVFKNTMRKNPAELAALESGCHELSVLGNNLQRSLADDFLKKSLVTFYASATPGMPQDFHEFAMQYLPDATLDVLRKGALALILRPSEKESSAQLAAANSAFIEVMQTYYRQILENYTHFASARKKAIVHKMHLLFSDEAQAIAVYQDVYKLHYTLMKSNLNHYLKNKKQDDMRVYSIVTGFLIGQNFYNMFGRAAIDNLDKFCDKLLFDRVIACRRNFLLGLPKTTTAAPAADITAVHAKEKEVLFAHEQKRRTENQAQRKHEALQQAARDQAQTSEIKEAGEKAKRLRILLGNLHPKRNKDDIALLAAILASDVNQITKKAFFGLIYNLKINGWNKLRVTTDGNFTLPGQGLTLKENGLPVLVIHPLHKSGGSALEIDPASIQGLKSLLEGLGLNQDNLQDKLKQYLSADLESDFSEKPRRI